MNIVMKILYALMLICIINDRVLAQDLNFKLDSCKILVYKKTKGYSSIVNKNDSFYVVRKYFQDGFIIDQYFFYKKELPDKIDTLLRMKENWFIKKGGKWQIFFDKNNFVKNTSWRVVDSNDCYLYIPLKVEGGLKSKKYTYKEEYCDDLGNNLNSLKTFDMDIGVVKIIIKNNLVYELMLTNCNR